ncbi:sulfurtransferase [Sciscionella sediminilitoris]|uniref:sulfurtransferase n=1 Tax=Sciscionella sediminilitoris TaxID=1445613 RepID=UPI0004DED0E9|nr:sulfurtransferase [Sciscionella sp. SE31]
MRGLISTTEAAELIDGGAAVVLDVRWRLTGPPGRADYERAHLPGAVFLDIDTDLADPPSTERGRHPLPEPDRLVAVFRAAGIGGNTQVIAYDDADGSVAARVWWLLRWLGHEQVAVLDGGFAAWQAERRPLTPDIPHPAAGDFTGIPGSMPVLDADAAAELPGTGVLLDARAPARYLGETEPVDARPGHIPGARNSPASAHLGPDGRWRHASELAEHFAALGAGTGKVGVYCGSGVTACSVVLAMEHAGIGASPALYPGSYSQWSADERREVAQGHEGGEVAP